MFPSCQASPMCSPLAGEVEDLLYYVTSSYRRLHFISIFIVVTYREHRLSRSPTHSIQSAGKIRPVYVKCRVKTFTRVRKNDGSFADGGVRGAGNVLYVRMYVQLPS